MPDTSEDLLLEVFQGHPPGLRPNANPPKLLITANDTDRISIRWDGITVILWHDPDSPIWQMVNLNTNMKKTFHSRKPWYELLAKILEKVPQ